MVSVDRGRTWQPAELERPDSSYAWYPWTAQVVLEPGARQIWSRATDQLGRTQPLDGSVDWNPNGYEWAGVFKADVTVE